MATLNTPKIYLKDYTRPQFEVDSLNLDFDLNEDFCRVIATSKIKTLAGASKLFLDGVDLELISIHVNGQLLNASGYKLLPEGLEIPGEEWFDSSEGLRTVRGLLDRIRHDPADRQPAAA